MIDADIMHRNSITQKKSKMNLVQDIILVRDKYNFHIAVFYDISKHDIFQKVTYFFVILNAVVIVLEQKAYLL